MPQITVLNLGCGTKPSNEPEVTNIDWSIYLRIKKNFILRSLASLFFSKERRERLSALGDNIMIHNLSKGIPFPNDSVDVVYHSHLFEHLDQDIGLKFLQEIKRVLKPGGIVRISVPDLENLTREYLAHADNCKLDPKAKADHDTYIASIILQSVRRESSGTSMQRPLLRSIENFLLGDARKRGETHQWMYDQHNLGYILEKAGFSDPAVRAYNTSLIPNWNKYRLDTVSDGMEYKPGSLYMEAINK